MTSDSLEVEKQRENETTGSMSLKSPLMSLLECDKNTESLVVYDSCCVLYCFTMETPQKLRYRLRMLFLNLFPNFKTV